MSESERQNPVPDPVPQGTTSAIPGRDDANPGERDVLEAGRNRPDHDVMGPAAESPEPDVMGEPNPADPAHPDVMGTRQPLPDETLGDDPDFRPEP